MYPGIAALLSFTAVSSTPPAFLDCRAIHGSRHLQNAVQRVHLAHIPPTTPMTGNTTQAVLDAVDLVHGPLADAPLVCTRFTRTVRGILWFAGATRWPLFYTIGAASGASHSPSLSEPQQQSCVTPAGNQTRQPHHRRQRETNEVLHRACAPQQNQWALFAQGHLPTPERFPF